MIATHAPSTPGINTRLYWYLRVLVLQYRPAVSRTHPSQLMCLKWTSETLSCPHSDFIHLLAMSTRRNKCSAQTGILFLRCWSHERQRSPTIISKTVPQRLRGSQARAMAQFVSRCFAAVQDTSRLFCVNITALCGPSNQITACLLSQHWSAVHLRSDTRYRQVWTGPRITFRAGSGFLWSRYKRSVNSNTSWLVPDFLERRHSQPGIMVF